MKKYSSIENWVLSKTPKHEDISKTGTEIIIKNPLTAWIKESVTKTVERINFAVPFISSFSLSILVNTESVIDKRVITRFDESSISSFDLPTLKSLLDLGFEIRYENKIHLKLYITDNEAYVTSSNFTKGGFEDNVELTTKVDSCNVQTCLNIFNELWTSTERNKLNYELIENNWEKYEVLRKRESYNKKEKNPIEINQVRIGTIDIQEIINEAFFVEPDIIEKRQKFSFEANKLRRATKERLKRGFDKRIFYVDKKNENLRKQTLFYDFAYGVERELAGVGLYESQFKTVFEHPQFDKVIKYICPEIIGMKPWNFNDKDILLEFCDGIFEFDIPSYKEAIPIRLVSYFHPEQFLPIFNLAHLKDISEAFGISTNAETQGGKLYAYNLFLAEQMKTLPYNNYIKSYIAYQIKYVVELYTRLRSGESYDKILTEGKKGWEQRLIKRGMLILEKLNKNKSLRKK